MLLGYIRQDTNSRTILDQYMLAGMAEKTAVPEQIGGALLRKRKYNGRNGNKLDRIQLCRFLGSL